MDEKNPDGYTYDSFKTGKHLAWDFTLVTYIVR
jgi:hypothetical protein